MDSNKASLSLTTKWGTFTVVEEKTAFPERPESYCQVPVSYTAGSIVVDPFECVYGFDRDARRGYEFPAQAPPLLHAEVHQPFQTSESCRETLNHVKLRARRNGALTCPSRLHDPLEEAVSVRRSDHHSNMLSSGAGVPTTMQTWQRHGQMLHAGDVWATRASSCAWGTSNGNCRHERSNKTLAELVRSSHALFDDVCSTLASQASFAFDNESGHHNQAAEAAFHAQVAFSCYRMDRDKLYQYARQKKQPSASYQSLSVVLDRISAMNATDCCIVLRRVYKLGPNAEQILQCHFERYGTVVKVMLTFSAASRRKERISTSPPTPSGLAFVQMSSMDEVERALAAGNEQVTGGVAIKVQRFQFRGDRVQLTVL
eukprot:TRINITY_DN6984_c0_g1_i3.p1 TRINITY_DN6984_c0_g1~~TRINITY_DN6984_c0_g1_i3.p1  ORF type:complete len:409 (+),score=34.23 TRINITY_DN6984_c0_g1_i3:112-1227(+)